jgi:hypothetical protein
MRVNEPLGGKLGKARIELGHAGEPAGLHGRDRGGSQPAERLPDHVAGFGDGVENWISIRGWTSGKGRCDG